MRVFVGLCVCVLEVKGSLGSSLVLTDSMESMQLFLHSHKGGLLIASEWKVQGFQFGQCCGDNTALPKWLYVYIHPVLMLLTHPAQILEVLMTESYRMKSKCQQPLLIMMASQTLRAVKRGVVHDKIYFCFSTCLKTSLSVCLPLFSLKALGRLTALRVWESGGPVELVYKPCLFINSCNCVITQPQDWTHNVTQNSTPRPSANPHPLPRLKRGLEKQWKTSHE